MFVRSVIGALVLVIAFGPLLAGSLRLRQRLFPTWAGAPGWLVQFVLVLIACLVVILGLGTIGWYSLVPTTFALTALGLAMWFGAGRLTARELEVLPVAPERLGRPVKVVAVVAVAMVSAMWGARTYVALSHGMVSIDSLWYHLPLAARYYDLHSITGVFHDVDNLSGFYPVNTELLHSLGMVVLGNDLLSMVMNFGWGALALLAAWCIGRPFGVGAVCVTTVSVLLCAPVFVGTQPGAAHVDIVGVTVVLVIAALLITASPKKVTSDPYVLALVAMLVGFMVGTKWTLVPIAVLLTVGVLVFVPRGRRLRRSAMWLGIVAVLGSFSYLRNWIKAGNPVPPATLKVGPIGWDRKVPELEGTAALTKFLFDGDAWHAWLLPGLSQWFGYGWWAALGLVFLGWALSIVTGPGPLIRMLGVVALLSFGAYLVQPQLLERMGEPFFFTANFRYGSAAIALGLVLLPLSPLLTRRFLLWSVALGALAIVGVMQLDSAVWPVELRELRWEEPVRGADAVAGLVFGLVTLAVGLLAVFRGRSIVSAMQARLRTSAAKPRRPTQVVAATVALVALLFGVVGLERFYLAHRYTSPDAPTPYLPLHWEAWEWARDIHDERIGFRPPVLSYPFYGNELTNFVEKFPVLIGEAAAFRPPRTKDACVRFKRMVNERRYDYLVFFASFPPFRGDAFSAATFEQASSELIWLNADPAASVAFRRPLEAVYRVDGRLDLSICEDLPPL